MKIVLLLLSTSLALNLHSQDDTWDNEIGILGGIQLHKLDYGKFGIEFRHSLSPKLKFKISGNYDAIGMGDLMNHTLVHDTDTLRIYRTESVWDRLYTVRGGFDYEPLKYVSIGANLILGLNDSRIGMFDKGSAYNSDNGQWESCNECVYNYHGEVQREPDNGSLNLDRPFGALIGKNRYAVYGLDINVGVKIPFLNRWEVGVFYSPEITRNTLLNSTIYYKGTDMLEKEFDSFTRLQHYADLKLRFKI